MSFNANIYFKELKQYRRLVMIWCACISTLIVVGMAFYPVLMRGETFKQVTVLLKNPFIKELISAFGSNLERLSNVLGFYCFRNALFVMLLGSFFPILLAGKILSQEENGKTTEFLLSKPVTRSEVALSKLAAFLTHLLILNLVIVITGLASLEIFKGQSDYSVKAFLIHSGYAFLLMLTFGSAGFFLALWIKRGRPIPGIFIGIIMGGYFLDVLSNVTKSVAGIGYLSPFKFVDSAVLQPDYGFTWWRVLYFVGVSFLFFALSFLIYKKKDILV